MKTTLIAIAIIAVIAIAAGLARASFRAGPPPMKISTPSTVLPALPTVPKLQFNRGSAEDDQADPVPATSPEREQFFARVMATEKAAKEHYDSWTAPPLLDEILGDAPKKLKYGIWLEIPTYYPRQGDSQGRMEFKIRVGVARIRDMAPQLSEEQALRLFTIPADQLRK